MKGTRLIVLILSILLLTISSGLLFYKNLFLLDSPFPGGKVDFEELRYTDLQINSAVALARLNLNADSTQLEIEVTRLKELLNIVTDVNKSTPDLRGSIKRIKTFFDLKILDLNKFQTGIKELKLAVDNLNPTYNELVTNKIKFSLDNKDFFREAFIDALSYVLFTNKDKEVRLSDDKKILSQILNYAKSPNPSVQKFSTYIDIILKRSKEIESLTGSFYKDNSINNDLTIVGKYYRESENSKTQDGEIFLTMVFGAIVLYLIAVVLIIKKLT